MFESEPYKFSKLGYIRIPSIKIDDDEIHRLKLKKDSSNEEYLRNIIEIGFNEKVPKDKIDVYRQRVELEFNEITRLHFTSYFLLVYRVINFCKKNNILNGYGRGSCAGSLILYLIGVTKVDPIRWDLLFERFISAARTEIKEFDGEKYIKSSSLPDVDIDSDGDFKSKINSFIDKEYPSKTCAIKTLGTLQGKIVLKDSYKVMEEVSEEEAKVASNLIESKFGKIQSIEDALKVKKNKIDEKDDNKEFQSWAKKHPKTIQIANKLCGLIRNKGVHASGIIISDEKLLDVMPVEMDKDGVLITGFDMEDAQLFGIKVDNLGLKNLSIFREIFELTKTTFEDIDIDNEEIYQFLCHRNEFYGIFQASEGLGKQCLQKIQPLNLDDITLSVSVGRPGSMKYLNEICEIRKTGELKSIDHRITDILSPTYNILIYQEQVMKLAVRMANFTLQEADGLRKGIGKKIKEKVLEYKDKFINGAKKNNYNQELIDEIWGTILASADYSFNKSHAKSYASLTAATVYAKIKYTKEFFLASLKNAKNEQKPFEAIAKIAEELPLFGIKLLPPHILKSDIDFKIEGNDIRAGLANVKGITEKNIEKLSKFRNKYSNKFDIFRAANESEISITVLGGLIMAGSLDDMLTNSRSRTFAEAHLWNVLTDKEKNLCMVYGERYKYNLTELVKDLDEKLKDEKGKPLIKDSRRLTIRKDYTPHHEVYVHNTKNEKFCSYFWEKTLLGFAYSSKLSDIWRPQAPDIQDVFSVKNALPKDHVFFIAEVIEVHKGKTKKGDNYIRLQLSDECGSIGVFMFKSTYKDVLKDCIDNNGRLPEEKDYVVIKGEKKDGDTVFADSVSIQDVSIFTKSSQLNKGIKK